MKKSKKKDQLINHYRFMIGTLTICLIALISGLASSIRTDKIDFLFFVGGGFAYFFGLILSYYWVKLIQILKDL